MALATLSSQNQITVPKHILKDLAISPRSRLFVHRRGQRIVLEPINESVAKDTHGALASFVTADKRDQSFDEIMKETKQKTARKLIQKNASQ